MSRLSKKFFISNVGWDGVFTFFLSIAVFFISFSVLFWFFLFKVIYLAISAKNIISSNARILVLGYQLNRKAHIQKPYEERLDSAAQNFKVNQNSTLYLLGGKAASALMSEAEAGKNYLLSKNIPESAIYLEDKSAHTLENLANVRALLSVKDSTYPLYLITSRYHLYRSITFAKGLGLDVLPNAAEAKLEWSWKTLLLLLLEAWFMHWYYCGRYWSILTGNKKMFGRIS